MVPEISGLSIFRAPNIVRNCGELAHIFLAEARQIQQHPGSVYVIPWPVAASPLEL